MLIKVEELNADLSRVRLFHTSVARAIATWPTWPGAPGFTGDFAEYVAKTFPTSTAADFAVLEAGVVSEETYVEQGLYWSTGMTPILEYVMNTYHPDLLMTGVPTTDEFQHQFLGLVSPTLPNGDPNPAYDDVNLDGIDRRPGRRAGGLHQGRLHGGRRLPDPRPGARRRQPGDVRLVGPRLRPAVPGHRREQGARGPRPPLEAPDLELPDRRSARRSARPRPAGPAARSRST